MLAGWTFPTLADLLGYWQTDADLAAIRDADDLSPEVAAFWAEVEALRREAEASLR